MKDFISSDTCASSSQHRAWKVITALLYAARRTEGSPIVEFALVLPIMMILITGMASVGIFLSNYLALTNTVDSAARTMSMTRGMGYSDPCNYAIGAATSNGIGLNMSAITWQVKWTPQGGSSATYGSSCPGRAILANDTVSVSAQYPAVLMLYGLSPTNFNVVAQTSEQVQ